MKRKQTISIASDTRGRVPFALISVVLLSTSVVAVSILNQRPTPERDISPELVNERTTTAVETLLSDAVSDAIKEAGQEPVTQKSGNEIGAALSGGGADSSEIFERYVRLRIYLKVSQRLEQTTQRRSSPSGDVSGQASLPELSKDRSEIEDAIDKVTLTTAAESDDLQKGEYEVTIDGIEQTVTAADREIHQEENSYTVSDETAVFEMHSQVTEYQEMLDSDLERLLYARQYPLFAGKATYENLRGEPTSASAFPELIENQEQEVFVNEINYKFQQAAFGTTDQSYPSMMGTGYQCLGHTLGGQFFDGVSGNLMEKLPLPKGSKTLNLFTEGSPVSYPGELSCYLVMYNSVGQATTTGYADLPDTVNFAENQSDWQPRKSHYNHVEDSHKTVNDFTIDLSNSGEELAEEEFDSYVAENTLAGERTIRIDQTANKTFIDMFDKDSDFFGDGTDDNDEAVREAFEASESYEYGFDGEDVDNKDEITDVQEAEINQLRKKLIRDIEPVEVTNTQMLTSENVYGELIYQIEQNEDTYVYSTIDESTNRPYRIYGLRNAYLKQIINILEKAEKNRQQTVDDMESSGMDVTESLVLAQASLEGEQDNPARIEDIAEEATHSSRGSEVDRFEDARREAYIYDPNRDQSVNDGSVELDSSGVPEEVTENMLFEFFGGSSNGLPEANKEIGTVRYKPLRGSSKWDNGGRPSEAPKEEKAYIWNIRPVDLENDIYRMTNGHRNFIDRPIGGSTSTTKTYMQVHKINEDMNLSPEAEEHLGEDMYTITILRVPQTSDPPTNPIDDPEELMPPEPKPASEEDFEFDVFASPGYLSGLPITREAEPTIRPAGEGARHARNTVHTPLSSNILNPIPNPGIPIVIPTPKPLWILSANYWKTDIKGEYARFELQSDSADELDAGPENYVRQDQTVHLKIGGSKETVGSVEPIGFHATGHYPMVLPGRFTLKRIPIAKKHKAGKGSFGTGNSHALIYNGQERGKGRERGKGERERLLPAKEERSGPSGKPPRFVPWPGWRPEHCTPGWPEVGPGVNPMELERGCADYGTIGEILSYQGKQTVGGALSSRLAESAMLIHVEVANGEPENDEVEAEARELCAADEPCPDVPERDRDS